MPFITIQNLNIKVEYNPAISLLNNLLMAKVPIETVCGGRAACGKCRIKVISESNKYLTPVNKAEKNKLKHLVDEGWRLACQTYALKDVEIYIPKHGTIEGIILL
jgi:ferredoxin